MCPVMNSNEAVKVMKLLKEGKTFEYSNYHESSREKYFYDRITGTFIHSVQYADSSDRIEQLVEKEFLSTLVNFRYNEFLACIQ